MKIILHGGNCCGMKHIYGLRTHPPGLTCARKGIPTRTSFGQSPWSGGSNDMMHSNKYGKCDFFNEEAPKESYEERLKRFIAFIKKHRSHGIIEVVLNVTQTAWIPILKELDFKKVSWGKNSNTANKITVYHLVH